MYENPVVEDLIISITDRCNLNCAHCFKGGAGTEELPLRVIKKLIDEAVGYGLKRVDYSGGESFLYSQLDELIEYSKQYPDIEYGFITNGLLVSESMLDKISELPHVYIQISMDGASKTTYERVRGEGTFESFMSALELIKAHRIKHKRTRTVVNSVNYVEIPDMYRLAISHGMLPSFLFAAEEGNATENWEWLNLPDIKKIHVNNMISQLNKTYNLPVGMISPGGGCDLSNGRERKLFAVGADGKVFFCDYLLDQPLGNLEKESLAEILKGDVMQHLYENESKRVEGLKEKCDKCVLFSECRYGCPGEARLHNDYSMCQYKKLFFACLTNQYI